MVRILKSENVQDLCCIEIPKEINYADHLLIGTCLSEKHLNSTFIKINQKYKMMKPIAEQQAFLRRKLGNETKWCAIDLGKIVIHLFIREAREFYDLETLWTCGSEFDEKLAEFREEREQLEKKFAYIEVTEQTSSNSNK